MDHQLQQLFDFRLEAQGLAVLRGGLGHAWLLPIGWFLSKGSRQMGSAATISRGRRFFRQPAGECPHQGVGIDRLGDVVVEAGRLFQRPDLPSIGGATGVTFDSFVALTIWR